MSNDMLLAKSELPEGWIDMGVGEAAVVREELAWAFRGAVGIAGLDMGYQAPEGWGPLHRYLEKKHGKPVIIANGAKHALMAVMHAASHTRGPYGIKKDTLVTSVPYWSSFPRMAEANGLQFANEVLPNNSNVLVLASPNNPTGELEIGMGLDKGPVVVHDAAYWSRAYREDCVDANLPACHVRIYSMSKYLGLSSLRVGYAVFESDSLKLYDAAREYIETTTSGVSVASQNLVLSVLKTLDDYPKATSESMDKIRNRLWANRCAFAENLDQAGLVGNSRGMFAWCDKRPGYDPQKARVRVVDGAPFGCPDQFRASLGGSLESCREAGKRLGAVARGEQI